MRRAWFFLLLSAPAWAAPRIEFREKEYDFGLLTQGTTVQHSFVFRNTGGAPLEIQSVNTSCGCTAALAADKWVPPGGAGRIEVSYDSRGKLGDVDKQIRVWTNDTDRTMTVLTIRGKVVPSSHPEITGTENLFRGSCAACHAAPSSGKTGEALYSAACAMCHNPRPDGGAGVAPPPEVLAEFTRKGLVAAIADGLPDASMPGFSLKRGGPLDDGQIKSLERFIRSLKKK